MHFFLLFSLNRCAQRVTIGLWEACGRLRSCRMGDTCDELCPLLFDNILYTYYGKTWDIRSITALRMREFPMAQTEGTSDGEGLYLTVNPVIIRTV